MEMDLEPYLESVSQAPQPLKAYKKIQLLIESCLGAARGDPAKIRARNNIWVSEVPISAHALLIDVFQFEAGEDGLWATKEKGGAHGGPSQQTLDLMATAQDMIECLIASLDEGEEGPEEMKKQPEEEDEEAAALNAALAMSLGDGVVVPEVKKQKKSADMTGLTDEEIARRMAEEEPGEEDADPKRATVNFERFNDENVIIDPARVEEVNQMQAALGEPYVDPQFPASDQTLYLDPEDANTWECFGCHKRNALPPLFAPPSSQQEARELQEKLDSIKCRFCLKLPPHVANVRFMHRPAVWLRPAPGNSDPVTEMLYPTVTDTSIRSRLCTGFIRDDMNNTLGSSWAVIRSEARPEDVVQGAIGNCWFAGSLCVVAQKPELISKLFVTKEFNKHGAYLVQLCHAGKWIGILLDDLFPCSKPWDGRIEGGTIHFARGGELSYLQSRRRQLWVPLIEKAAAKLYGCYGALSSGTFSEALGLLTGYPVESMRLYDHSMDRKRRAELLNQRQTARTMAMLRGESVEDFDDEEEYDEAYQEDLLWTRLLSFYEAGYIMGLACAAEAVEKTRDIVGTKGLQSPHAYGILEVRELEVPGSTPTSHGSTGSGTRTERLIKVRNPWGERAPKTWNGDWGRDWPGWTFDLKLKLGVVNKSNVKMHDDMGIFWMSFKDVRNYFAQVEVCRTHPPSWGRISEKLWLTSSTGGAGEYLEFETLQRTEVDLSLWQEKHTKREAAINAKSTNQDIGLVVLRWRRKKDGDASVASDFKHDLGNSVLEFVARGSRTRADETSLLVSLEGGYTYVILPMSFSLLREDGEFPRQACFVMHHNHHVGGLAYDTLPLGQPLQESGTRKLKSSWELINAGIWAMLDSDQGHKSRHPLADLTNPGNPHFSDFIVNFFRDGSAGYIIGVENLSETDACGVQYDGTESEGFAGTRASAVCFDVIPPRTRFLISISTVKKEAERAVMQMGCQYVNPEMAACMLTPAEDFHIQVPLPPHRKVTGKGKSAKIAFDYAAFEGPCAELTGRAEPENVFCGHADSPKQHGGASASASASAALPEEEDEDAAALKAALALSLEEERPATPAGESDAAEAAAVAEAMALSQDPKVAFEARVKTFFAQLVKDGTPPNVAAVEAVRLAREAA